MNRDSEKREWYSVSADSARFWVTLTVTLVLLVGGFVGYNQWQSSRLKVEAEALLEQATDLVEEIDQRHRDVWKLLDDARTAYSLGDYGKSVDLGKRCVAIAKEIVNPTSGVVRVLQAVGPVESRAGNTGSWERVANGDRLENGDWVKTGDNGSLELLFPGGAIFTLRPNTLVNLNNQLTNISFGGVRVDTSSQRKRVKTPDAEADLGRDSQAQITVAADRSSSSVRVAKGDAEVVTDSGLTRRLGPLQQLAKSGEDWSEVEDFTAAPRLLEPGANRVLEPSEVADTSFTWEAVSDAAKYRFQVSGSSLFVANKIDNEYVATSIRLGTLEVGTFYWHVAAVDANGALGAWSSPRLFQVGQPVAANVDPNDKIPPRLVIQSAEVLGELVIVTGQTDTDDAEVTVEGEGAFIRGDGSFRKTIEITEAGWHEIKIVASDRAGNQKSETKRVYVDVP